MKIKIEEIETKENEEDVKSTKSILIFSLSLLLVLVILFKGDPDIFDYVYSFMKWMLNI